MQKHDSRLYFRPKSKDIIQSTVFPYYNGLFLVTVDLLVFLTLFSTVNNIYSCSLGSLWRQMVLIVVFKMGNNGFYGELVIGKKSFGNNLYSKFSTVKYYNQSFKKTPIIIGTRCTEHDPPLNHQ